MILRFIAKKYGFKQNNFWRLVIYQSSKFKTVLYTFLTETSDLSE